MRVQTAKNKETDKSEERQKRSESSVLANINKLKNKDSSQSASNGVFARILEDSKKEVRKNSIETTGEKQNEDSKVSKDTEKKIAHHKREKTDEDGGSESGNQTGENNDQNQFGTPLFKFSQSNSSEFSTPPARSIFHIADLERIVSTIRTESFDNSKQALISLKNSVLKGLQIKITLDENGCLKAEFLALNHQIKKQIEARKKELKNIFRNRSLNLKEIEVSVPQDLPFPTVKKS